MHLTTASVLVSMASEERTPCGNTQAGAPRRLSSPPPPLSATSEAIEIRLSTCLQTCSACLMLIVSMISIASLGVIAGGAWWTAQSLSRLTEGDDMITLVTSSGTT